MRRRRRRTSQDVPAIEADERTDETGPTDPTRTVDATDEADQIPYVGVRHRPCSAIGCSALVAPGNLFCSKHVLMAHDMQVEFPSNLVDELPERDSVRQALAHAEYRLVSSRLVDVLPLVGAPADRLSAEARTAVWTYHTRMTGAMCPACLSVSTWIAARLAAGATTRTLDVYSDRGECRCPACGIELFRRPIHPFPRFRWERIPDDDTTPKG